MEAVKWLRKSAFCVKWGVVNRSPVILGSAVEVAADSRKRETRRTALIITTLEAFSRFFHKLGVRTYSAPIKNIPVMINFSLLFIWSCHTARAGKQSMAMSVIIFLH
jgi:phenylalanyl-tRNA synthetase alpha subunit